MAHSGNLELFPFTQEKQRGDFTFYIIAFRTDGRLRGPVSWEASFKR